MKHLTEKQAWLVLVERVTLVDKFLCHISDELLEDERISKKVWQAINNKIKIALANQEVKSCAFTFSYRSKPKRMTMDEYDIRWRKDYCKEQAKKCGGK